MNYEESRAYIRAAELKKGIVLGLDNMRELMRRLGDPQDELKYVHVAGTNGKGSGKRICDLGYIKKGVEEGAVLACGGERYTEGECAKGYYVRPTVFDNCTSDMTIVKEEIFGPVVTIQTFKTEQEAIDMANDTEYGLAGAVFTADGSRALRVIKEIRAGITWINCYNPAFNEAPWGGYKKSGIGRDLGVQGLEEYQSWIIHHDI